ncbi:hypothetical protein [Hyalangium versicolor]|uniref:hypothetical protein n=1 Tax=Hyalangium versicolor TaxID=2861190 RepID=UPI001CCF2C93|nr:hypothetical protein [Hyalangium versicolor]
MLHGLAFDPVLASLYSRWSQVSFATDVAGVVLAGNDDSEYSLESQNTWWRENFQARVQLPLFIFAGEPLLAYTYATVSSLADAQGHQPVVHADTYELDGPFLLPIASNVDRFFDTYSRFLEELAATPEFQRAREPALTFPWDVPHLLARDTRLVELVRAGHFDAAMPQDDSTRQWRASLLAAASHR